MNKEELFPILIEAVKVASQFVNSLMTKQNCKDCIFRNSCSHVGNTKDCSDTIAKDFCYKAMNRLKRREVMKNGKKRDN